MSETLSRARRIGRSMIEFQVPGSKFQVTNRTWNLEPGTWNSKVEPPARHGASKYRRENRRRQVATCHIDRAVPGVEAHLAHRPAFALPEEAQHRANHGSRLSERTNIKDDGVPRARPFGLRQHLSRDQRDDFVCFFGMIGEMGEGGDDIGIKST